MCLQGVVMFSITLFFSKLVSYTFMDWLPYYIKNTAIGGTYYNTAQSAYLATLFDVGGIAGSSNRVSLYSSLSCDYYRSHCCRVFPRSDTLPRTGMLIISCDFSRHGLQFDLIDCLLIYIMQFSSFCTDSTEMKICTRTWVQQLADTPKHLLTLLRPADPQWHGGDWPLCTHHNGDLS